MQGSLVILSWTVILCIDKQSIGLAKIQGMSGNYDILDHAWPYDFSTYIVHIRFADFASMIKHLSNIGLYKIKNCSRPIRRSFASLRHFAPVAPSDCGAWICILVNSIQIVSLAPIPGMRSLRSTWLCLRWTTSCLGDLTPCTVSSLCL